MQSVTADDADKVITYAGFPPIQKGNRVVESRGDYKDTLSMTANANATASFRFRGEPYPHAVFHLSLQSKLKKQEQQSW